MEALMQAAVVPWRTGEPQPSEMLYFLEIRLSKKGVAAIWNTKHAVLNLERVSIADNLADNLGVGASTLGGGIWNDGVLALGDGVVIVNNRAGRGGGIFNAFNASASLNGVLIEQNHSDVDGAGIFNSGELEITRSTIRSNDAMEEGGGVWNISNMTITRSTVADNSAQLSGGGIYTKGDAEVSIVATTVADNLASDGRDLFGGGGIYAAPSDGGSVKVERSTVSGNFAQQGGGLMLFPTELGVVSIQNSTVSSNRALSNVTSFGGGISILPSNGYVDLIDNTITQNWAGESGGGLYNRGIVRRLNNNIIAGNDIDTGISSFKDVAPGNAIIHVLKDDAGMVTSPTTNLIGHYSFGVFALVRTEFEEPTSGNQFSGLSSVFTDPRLDPELRKQPGAVTATHALNVDSPAIDKGRSTRIVDQIGKTVVDVDANPNFDASAADIGAFEAQVVSSAQVWKTTTLNDQGGTSVSQFAESDNEVMYGLGFDDGRRPAYGTPSQTTNGLDHEPGFLGFEFDTGPQSFGGITGGGSVLGVPIPKFGGEVVADVSARIGLEYGYYVNSGSVETSYEGLFTTSLNNVLNSDGSIKTVMIDTATEFVDGSLFTVSPRFGAYVDLVIQFDVLVTGEACVFACIDGTILEFEVDYTETLFSINRQFREGDKGADGFKDSDDVDYTGKPLKKDSKEPLFLVNAIEGKYTTDPNNGANPPAFSGEVRFLEEPIGQLLEKGTTKAFNKLKEKFDEVAKHENAKKKNEKKLAKTTDPDEAAKLKQEIVKNEQDLAKAKQEKQDQEKKKQEEEKQGPCQPPGLTAEFGEADGTLLGVQVDIGVGAKCKGVGVNQALGSLAVTIPDVQLSDLALDNATGKLSATTDDFGEGSVLDAKRQVAKLDVDVAGIAGPKLGIPAGKYSVSALGVTGEAQLLSYTIQTVLAVTQDVQVTPFFDDPDGASPGAHVAKYQFTDDVMVRVNNGPEVLYTIDPMSTPIDHDKDDLDDDGFIDNTNPQQPATDKVLLTPAVSFMPGDRLDVSLVNGGNVDVVPKMKVGNRFTNDIGLEVTVRGIFEALSLEISKIDIDVGPLFKDDHQLGDFDLVRYSRPLWTLPLQTTQRVSKCLRSAARSV